MGWCQITNIETGEIELEVGNRPDYLKDDDFVCPMNGLAYNDPPKTQAQPKQDLKTKFWFCVQFYAWPSPWRGQFTKIKTNFNPLKTKEI